MKKKIAKAIAPALPVDGATDNVTQSTSGRGFSPVSSDKSRIISKKRPDLFGGQDNLQRSPQQVTFGGSDNTEDVISDDTEINSQTLITFQKAEYDQSVAKAADAKSAYDNQDLVAQIRVMRSEIDAVAQKARDTEEALVLEAKVAKDEVIRLKGVFSATGNSGALADAVMPQVQVDRPYGSASAIANSATSAAPNYGYNINTRMLPSSSEPQGAARDFVDILNNSQYTPRSQVFDPNDGDSVEQLDNRQLDRFLQDNRDHLSKDMERFMKGNGFLRGSTDMGRDGQAGPTLGAAGSIRDAFLPYLSSYLRTSHQPRYIFHQFATERVELGRVPGTTILVPRFQWIDDPTDPEDYVLDSSTSSATISPDSQALQMLTTPVQIFGYGLGRGTRVGTRAISIPEFIQASSMVELQNALSSRLGQNYNAFEDMSIRRIFQQTLVNPANIYYNNGGEVTQTPSTIVAGRDGTLTEEILNSLASEMTRRQIPTYENGFRVGIIQTYATTQFKNSLGDKIRATTQAEIQEVTNILNAGVLGDALTKPSGYLGTYCGFMLFESGTIGVGLPGQPNSEGVYDNIFGAGTALVGRDNFFFGPGVVGKGVSLPMNIRMDDSGSFGTRMRFIWRSMEGWGSLDCTSTNPGQQDRVLCLRTADRLI